ARLPVDELGELFGLELDDDDVDSAGGLLAKALGKVPIPGAEVEVGGLHLQAERAGGRRRQIATILARAVEPPAADEEDEHS
ncbi:HlyC/CorC family transporter, partial [Georgenia sp. 311]